MVSRRGFLVGAAATGGAAAAVAGGLSGCTETAPPPFDPADWGSVRGQFGLRRDLAQYAAFVLASHPRQVSDAIAEHRRGLDADPEGYLEQRIERDRAARTAVAGQLGVAPAEVALTNSTTHGLGLLYTGLRLDPGDEILTTEHDFYATHESLRLRAERTGAVVRRVALYDDPARASTDRIVAALRDAVGPRTRVVALTWVHSGTGVKLPIRAIADALDGRALLCVDGVHGFAAEDVDAAELGCDVLISGCHKWLFGPRGTGFVWAKPAAWERFTPVVPSFDADGRGPGPLASPGGYQAYEHRWALPAAVEFHTAIGRHRIAARVHELARRLKEGLSTVDGLRLVTPMSAELSAGIVCAEFADLAASEAVARLRGAGVSASVTPYAKPYLRFGASIVTDEADVEKTLAAVRNLR
ncbi:MAG: aminotransferase class V-fold PLP-dependent enzyme [Micromonosporaceae bacterium]